MRLLFILLTASFAFQGCSTLMFWQDDDDMQDVADAEMEEESSPLIDLNILEGDKKHKETITRSVDDLELKNARIWRRVDELEEQVTGLKEKLRVIEKGLTLGLLPEELKTPKEPKATARNTRMASDVDEEEGMVMVEPSAGKNVPPPAPSFDKALYDKKMGQAQDLYQQGKFGRAIVEYSSIGREFGDGATDGVHLYWIGRSWGALKEFQTARQYFIDFIKSYPTSETVPRAKLDLARVELALGLKETALQRFRRIIQEHPYEDAAEMAKMELKSMGRNL